MFSDFPERALQEVLRRLVIQRHQTADFIPLHFLQEAVVDDFFLAGTENCKVFLNHFLLQHGLFEVDILILDSRFKQERRLFLPVITVFIIVLQMPKQSVPERREKIDFHIVGRDKTASVPVKMRKNVMDTVLYVFAVGCKV
jgi:hypothetical protein